MNSLWRCVVKYGDNNIAVDVDGWRRRKRNSATVTNIHVDHASNSLMEKPQIILHSQKSVNYTVFDVKWIPTSAKFISLGNHARGTGALDIFEITHGDINLVAQVRMFEKISSSTLVYSARKTDGIQMWNVRRFTNAPATPFGHGKFRWLRPSLVSSASERKNV